MFIEKMNKAVILLALLSISAFAQGTFTDSRGGKEYKSIKIGKQTWMAQNLDYQGEDGNLGKCYEDKPENCEKYGRLYNWAEAMNIDTTFNKKKWGKSAVKQTGICPKGWHLPSEKEWQTLVAFAGGEKVAGEKLKTKSGWEYYYEGEPIGYNGTDEYGFSVLPAGKSRQTYKTVEGKQVFYEKFEYIGENSLLWATNEVNDNSAKPMGFDRRHGDAGLGRGSVKSDRFPVRCLKD
jgi:uncharacterized protein (TIGR02145 family)